jgi:hypothetical protein
MLYMGNTPAPREKLWNAAVYGLKKEPVFGIGFGNYSIIDPEQLGLWFPDEDFTDNKQFYYSSHAHNRFLNSAVEGGDIWFRWLDAAIGGAWLFVCGAIGSLCCIKAPLLHSGLYQQLVWLLLPLSDWSIPPFIMSMDC